MNLFLQTRKLTDRREDHLTEFFAAALELSPQVRKAFFDLVIAPFARAHGWPPSEISKISTQHCYDDASCRPDMLLTLSNGKLIACEHKLDAAETLGPELDDRLQLERYLDLPVDGLIYVRSSWKPPELHVLKHPKYIRPADREHFLWRDFYPLFEGLADPFQSWIREGFEALGFTPPHPAIGELDTEAEQRNFAKFWDKTRSFARDLGWYSSPGSIVQLYLEDNDASSASVVFIQPTAGGFQFRATPKTADREKCFASLAVACGTYPHPLEHGRHFVRRKEGKVEVYDIEASALQVLGRGGGTAAGTEDRMYEFASHFLRAVQNEEPAR